MKYILGIDLGTSYFKFGLFDEILELKGLGRVKVEKDTGNGELCEVPVGRFSDLIETGIAKACDNAGVAPSSIAAVGYSSQANSFLLMDDKDAPLTPLVLWPDKRTSTVFPEIQQLWDAPDFLETTAMGRGPSPTLCLNKLLWFKYNRPQIWDNTQSLMTISDYLIFFFTGEKVGDTGTASLTGLLDCRKADWWEKGFKMVDLDKNLFLPRCRPGEKVGRTNESLEKVSGIKRNTPFFAGSLDHHIAALGAEIRSGKDVSESTGTVLAAVGFSEKYTPEKDLFISPWESPRSYCRMAFQSNGAASLEWYRDNFASDYSIEQLVKMAEDEKSAGGLTAESEASKYKELEEVFSGISGKQSHGHFIYALMESTAYTLKDLLDQLCPDRKPEKVISTGGGAQSRLWMEIKSQVTGIRFEPSSCSESSCKGAAMITDRGIGA